MKTREEIIKELVEKISTSPIHHQNMAVKYALKSMPDANLFILAQDMGIELKGIKIEFGVRS